MIPVLFPANETEFTSNGIGVLTDVIEAPVVQDNKGANEISFRYPVGGIHYEDLGLNKLVLVNPDRITRPQPYRIYRIAKGLNKTIQVDAKHISHDMTGIPVSAFSATDPAKAAAAIKANAAVPCPFTVTTDIESILGFYNPHPQSAWDLLGPEGLAGVYGGDYIFDRFDVKLCKNIGSDNGITVRYGNNLTSFEQEENNSKCYTGVYPFWKNDEKVVELAEKIMPAPGNHDHTNILLLDTSSEWDTPPTDELLRAYTESYIKDNNIGVPEIAWTISYESLVNEYGDNAYRVFEDVALGDIVTVFFTEIGVQGKARVLKIEYDPILDRYTQIHLGKLLPDLADTIVRQRETAEKLAQLSVEAAKKMDKELSESLTQEDLMFRLTNGNKDNGIYMVGDDNKIYINCTYLKTGVLDAKLIKLRDKFSVYDPEAPDSLGGYLGYLSGIADTGVTKGIGISSPDGKNYIVVTTAGGAMRVGTNVLYMIEDRVYIEKDLYVGGTIHQNARSMMYALDKNESNRK